MRGLSGFDPYWIEEPTSPDDILGHRRIREALAPIRIATGEHVQNRVIFKQLLQAEAIDVVQIDACRVGGVNENLAILLLAAKFGVPVCPHAGGVGLCEMVQHLALFDFVAVSRSLEGRWIEYVDHLHEHFTAPVRVERGRYRVPEQAGGGAQLRDESIARVPVPRRTGLERGAVVTLRVDAHHHLWNLAVRDQPWIAGPAMAPLRRDFSLADLAAATAGSRIDHTVVVQTVADVGETVELLRPGRRLADHQRGRGLRRPDRDRRRRAARPAARRHRRSTSGGLRSLVQDEPDPEWLLRPTWCAACAPWPHAALPTTC